MSRHFPAISFLCELWCGIGQVIAESTAAPTGETRPFYDFLESCLRHKAEMVIFEAARAICNMRNVTLRELLPAVTVLQLFLSSSKPVLRFAAVRNINKVGLAGIYCFLPKSICRQLDTCQVGQGMLSVTVPL